MKLRTIVNCVGRGMKVMWRRSAGFYSGKLIINLSEINYVIRPFRHLPPKTILHKTTTLSNKKYAHQSNQEAKKIFSFSLKFINLGASLRVRLVSFF